MILFKNFKYQKVFFDQSVKLWESSTEVVLYKLNSRGWTLGGNEFDGNPILIYNNNEKRRKRRATKSIDLEIKTHQIGIFLISS